MTCIGYSSSIRPEEGCQKCPEFWEKEYARKYARLWQTMQPETAVEAAILENGVGLFAICDEKEAPSNTGLTDFTRAARCRRAETLYFPGERLGDVLRQRSSARLPARAEHPGLAGVVSHRGAEIQWQRKCRAGGLLPRQYAKPRLRVQHLGADL